MYFLSLIYFLRFYDNYNISPFSFPIPDLPIDPSPLSFKLTVSFLSIIIVCIQVFGYTYIFINITRWVNTAFMYVFQAECLTNQCAWRTTSLMSNFIQLPVLLFVELRHYGNFLIKFSMFINVFLVQLMVGWSCYWDCIIASKVIRRHNPTAVPDPLALKISLPFSLISLS